MSAVAAASEASLYFHTVRHLRPIQIWGRVALSFRKPRIDTSAPPALRAHTGGWVTPPERPRSQLSARRFRFLNVEHEVAQAADWNHPQWEKLWLYNLHYFDDRSSSGYRSLIERWIAENPPAAGNGWEPYPTSLRIVNWIKWITAGNEPSREMLRSLATQCRYLMQTLEWHLLGNHLFANAKALVCSGLFFSGPEAERWLGQGLEILARELREQILADGGHFELSPMYHSIILEDVLDLANLARLHPQALPTRWADEFTNAAARMLPWLLTMTHPDGRIAFMNDAAFGIASEVSDLVGYAGRLGIKCDGAKAEHLAQSGYLRIESGSACAILDVGRIGPDYLPGHAHADSLSFELSLHGQRMLVNSGTSTYQPSAERARQRATAAHNTLEIDGESSSEVWGSFRVARRARPFDFEILRDADRVTVRCAHDGYRRLPGRPIHRREWVLTPGQLKVADRVEGDCDKAIARYYFHPDRMKSAAGTCPIDVVAKSGHPNFIDATYHPEFGSSIANVCLQVETVDKAAAVAFNWLG